MESKIVQDIISEDTVRSIIFPKAAAVLTSHKLEELCISINKFIFNISSEHIWHKDEFKIQVPLHTDNTDLPNHLTSITCFGDNIEDEWLIVYLLVEISKEYPNLIIKVYDNDGEFLLIEAADFLPTWANPNTTDNRVFIYQGNIHFIPSNIVDIDTDLKIHEAIKIICDMPDQTRCNKIHQAVMKRCVHYPAKITENIHRAVVNLPLDIAALLSLKPSLISPIVNAYCNHDAIDVKACNKIETENLVQTRVKFTKCLYAMLVHSKVIKTKKSCKDDNKSSLGFKLTCGYRIIMSKLTGNVFSTKEFNKFLKSLTQNGYFKGNLEGSCSYKKLLDSAKDYFLTMECPIDLQVCNDISQLIHTKEFTSFKEIIGKQDLQQNMTEDSDEWLTIHPDQLNYLLNTRYGRKNKYKSSDFINHHTITSELSNFLKETSGFEGIETNNDGSEDQIEFDSSLFVNSLKNMINITSNGSNIDSDIDVDELEGIFLFEEDLDKELKNKLNIDGNVGSQQSNDILNNMIQSMKEEGGATGPTSNIFRTIGRNKTDFLDSDDDDE